MADSEHQQFSTRLPVVWGTGGGERVASAHGRVRYVCAGCALVLVLGGRLRALSACRRVVAIRGMADSGHISSSAHPAAF